MKDIPTIKKSWDSYAELLPAEACQIQIDETRRAFYAGALIMMGILKTPSENTSDEEIHKIITAADEELKAFTKELREETGITGVASL